ncbi:hypothetical protein [Methylomonas rhizoryzae]|uniref:hypothetical protein n=1 Tax=Methylomonas rhizoryzae TaxID=2608981 RepID=UPI0012323096|nr:hypothetical protein [Methylomonas rhizoryzae]
MRTPDIIFNETSITRCSVPDLTTARIAFEEFVSVIATLIDIGATNNVVRSQCCLQDVRIPTQSDDEWAVEEWLFDSTIDREMRSFVLTLDTKIPIENGISLDQELEEALIGQEYRIATVEGPDCFAVGFALYRGDIVVSVPTSPLWDVHQLKAYVCKDLSIVGEVMVDHASRESHCYSLLELFKKRYISSVTTAAELNSEKGKLFPNLRFSPDVADQIEQLDSRYISGVLAKLAKMNETAEHWRDAGSVAPSYLFQWRGESASTMSNSDHLAARKFRMPKGNVFGVFERHTDFSKSHRIHFIEDRNERDFIIGYIGNHLPTVLFPH